MEIITLFIEIKTDWIQKILLYSRLHIVYIYIYIHLINFHLYLIALYYLKVLITNKFFFIFNKL